MDIPGNKRILIGCIGLSLLLCSAQVMGNTIMILGSLILYILLLAWSCWNDFSFPVFLFFLPWSPIMRLSPSSVSIYTIGLGLACLIGLIKRRFFLRTYQVAAGVLIAFLSLVAKLLDGSGLAFDYIVFLMMIVLFPTVMQEHEKHKYDFSHSALFFSVGIVIAARCAMRFEGYANIRKFVRVHSYLTIVRRCGFYSDPNFYVAQILAALSGNLFLILQERRKKQLVFLGFLSLLLLYCGFLSGSKSFVIVFAIILLLWTVSIVKMRGRPGLKIALPVIFLCIAVYIASSAMFSSLIDVILTRFSFANDVDSFTTGRTELWKSYLYEMLSNVKTILLGKGFTNIKINGRASHNTIIQAFYQFGILGVPVLIYWLVCFYKEHHIDYTESRFDTKLWMVAIGTFLPWLAIDAIFFDEFFLLQMYMCMAIAQNGIQLPSTVNTVSKNNQYGGNI